jgi:hypothetical protein
MTYNPAASGGFTYEYAILVNSTSNASDLATVASTWTQYPLNLSTYSDLTGASFASLPVFTLGEGNYVLQFVGTCSQNTRWMRHRLYNVSDTTAVAYGLGRTSAVNNWAPYTKLCWFLEVPAGGKNYQIDYFASVASSYGLGSKTKDVADPWGTRQYGSLQIARRS